LNNIHTTKSPSLTRNLSHHRRLSSLFVALTNTATIPATIKPNIVVAIPKINNCMTKSTRHIPFTLGCHRRHSLEGVPPIYFNHNTIISVRCPDMRTPPQSSSAGVFLISISSAIRQVVQIVSWCAVPVSAKVLNAIPSHNMNLSFRMVRPIDPILVSPIFYVADRI